MLPLKYIHMKQNILRFPVSKLLLGSHFTFHDSFRKLLTPLIGKFDLLDKAVGLYDRMLALEQRIIVRPNSVADTRAIHDVDYRRDRLAGTISMIVRAHLSNPVESRRKAATLLRVLLSPFKGVAARSYYSTASEYVRLVQVLRSEQAQQAVAELGIGPEIEALDEANGQFSEAFDRKAKQMGECDQLSSIRTLDTRRKVDAAYYEITRLLESYAIVAPSDELEEVIGLHNGLAGNMRTIIANQGKKRKKKAEGEESNQNGE